MSGWYHSTAPVRFDVFYRDPDGGWHYWTQSPQFSASSDWTQAVWGTPAVPANFAALSFGLQLEATGTLAVDDYSLVDSGGPPANPAVSFTSPTSGAIVRGAVTLSVNATSPVGIARVDYLVNGCVVASSTTAPFTTTWDSSAAVDGATTFAARATDVSGSQATSTSVTATISNGTGGILSGLQGYWKFDESSGASASDSTGHCYTGATHGGNIWATAGKIHAGLQLGGPGSSNYVSMSFPIPTSGQVTYAGWANRADASGSYGLLGSSDGSGNGPLIQIPSGTSNVKFWRRTSTVSTTFTGVVPPPGTWFQWVLVDNPSAQTTTLYINGVPVGTNAYTAADSTTSTLEIGGYAGTSSLFKGLIDEVGVWNRTLSGTEVTTLYNSGAGLQYPFS